MKPSRKLFTVLSVALPLLLVVSMARAEEGSPSSSCTKFCEDGTPYNGCVMNIANPCMGHDKSSSSSLGTSKMCDATPRYRYSSFVCYDGYKMTEGSSTSCKTYEDWQNYAKSYCEGRCNAEGVCGMKPITVDGRCDTECKDIGTFSCPNVEEATKKCMANGMMTEKFWKDGCTYVECRKAIVPTKVDTSQNTASVVCKRMQEGNFWIFSCEDGKMMRYPKEGQSMMNKMMDIPKGQPTMMTVTPQDLCKQMQGYLSQIKERLEKSPDAEAQKKYDELVKRLAACASGSSSSVSSSSSSLTVNRTTNPNICIHRREGNCEITVCPGGKKTVYCARLQPTIKAQ